MEESCASFIVSKITFIRLFVQQANGKASMKIRITDNFWGSLMPIHFRGMRSLRITQFNMRVFKSDMTVEANIKKYSIYLQIQKELYFCYVREHVCEIVNFDSHTPYIWRTDNGIKIEICCNILPNNQMLLGKICDPSLLGFLWPLLLTWCNFNPNMDK